MPTSTAPPDESTAPPLFERNHSCSSPVSRLSSITSLFLFAHFSEMPNTSAASFKSSPGHASATGVGGAVLRSIWRWNSTLVSQNIRTIGRVATNGCHIHPARLPRFLIRQTHRHPPRLHPHLPGAPHSTSTPSRRHHVRKASKWSRTEVLPRPPTAVSPQ